jgi:quercetin dioxygenase-like cupin family protein
MTMALAVSAVSGLAAGYALANKAEAPAAEIKRTVLQRIEVPDSNYEVILGLAEVPADTASIGRHRHDGVETGYVIEGGAVMSVDGQATVSMKAGETYRIESGLAHDVATGSLPAKVIAVYVVEKGRPLATPLP